MLSVYPVSAARATSITTRIETQSWLAPGHKKCPARATSITTRIETLVIFMIKNKLQAARAASITTRIETTHLPLRALFYHLREQHPLQQGLRPYV